MSKLIEVTEKDKKIINKLYKDDPDIVFSIMMSQPLIVDTLNRIVYFLTGD